MTHFNRISYMVCTPKPQWVLWLMKIQDGETQPCWTLCLGKEEVSIIQSIPVSTSNKEDQCIRRGTKNGRFSVRSAYCIPPSAGTEYSRWGFELICGGLQWGLEQYLEFTTSWCGIFFFFYGELAKKFYPHEPTTSRRKLWTTRFAPYAAVNLKQHFTSFGHVVRQGMLGVWAPDDYKKRVLWPSEIFSRW